MFFHKLFIGEWKKRDCFVKTSRGKSSAIWIPVNWVYFRGMSRNVFWAIMQFKIRNDRINTGRNHFERWDELSCSSIFKILFYFTIKNWLQIICSLINRKTIDSYYRFHYVAQFAKNDLLITTFDSHKKPVVLMPTISTNMA